MTQHPPCHVPAKPLYTLPRENKTRTISLSWEEVLAEFGRSLVGRRNSQDWITCWLRLARTHLSKRTHPLSQRTPTCCQKLFWLSKEWEKNYSDAVVLTRIFLIFFSLWDNGGHDFLSSRGTLILFLCVCAILKLWRLLFDFQIGILLPMGCGFSKSQWCSGRTKLARLRIIVYTACTQMMR